MLEAIPKIDPASRPASWNVPDVPERTDGMALGLVTDLGDASETANLFWFAALFSDLRINELEIWRNT